MHPEIRVMRIQSRGELFKPTSGDLESGIVAAIKQEGVEVCRSDGFRLRSVGSRRPHHPDGSEVLWITEESSGDIAPWGPDTFFEMAGEQAFLASIEQTIETRRRERPRDRCYFFMGFVPPDIDLNGLPVHKGGLQSQIRWHFHWGPGIDLRTPHNRLLTFDTKEDLRLARLFSNAAGETSITMLKNYLLEYGARFTFTQPVGLTNRAEVPRTLFGFDSLHEALVKSLALRVAVEAAWIEHAVQIAQTEKALQYLPHVVLKEIRQSAVPSVAIIFPTDEDRDIGGVLNKSRVWAMPFAVSNPQYTLSNGGAVYEYENQA